MVRQRFSFRAPQRGQVCRHGGMLALFALVIESPPSGLQYGSWPRSWLTIRFHEAYVVHGMLLICATAALGRAYESVWPLERATRRRTSGGGQRRVVGGKLRRHATSLLPMVMPPVRKVLSGSTSVTHPAQ